VVNHLLLEYVIPADLGRRACYARLPVAAEKQIALAGAAHWALRGYPSKELLNSRHERRSGPPGRGPAPCSEGLRPSDRHPEISARRVRQRLSNRSRQGVEQVRDPRAGCGEGLASSSTLKRVALLEAEQSAGADQSVWGVGRALPGRSMALITRKPKLLPARRVIGGGEQQGGLQGAAGHRRGRHGQGLQPGRFEVRA